MTGLSFYQLLVENLKQTGWAEYIAVITGLGSVWYARKESILVYPVGIISVVIYVYLCYQAGLYADMGINAFYFLMSVYGWFMWTHRNVNTQKVRAITASSRIEILTGLAITFVSMTAIYFLLKNFTDSTVPMLDSFTTAIFIVGMWLMALKKIENWIYWIVGDLICIFLFPYKGLFFSGFQYLVFFILAISGYLEWRKRLNLVSE